MQIVQIPELFKPEIKRHYKLRQLKKFALGPFAETCVELRFSADLEKFDQLDELLMDAQAELGWDLFIAYFNNRYHVAVTFFSEQNTVEECVATLNESLVKVFGTAPEMTILAGDANYGEWDASYSM